MLIIHINTKGRRLEEKDAIHSSTNIIVEASNEA